MSEQRTLTGTIKAIMEPMSFASGFTKREFIVTDEDDKYPQDISLEVVKDKCSELDALTIGQRVKVSFNLRGRYNEKSDRYFNSLTAWRIEGEAAPATAPTDSPLDDQAVDADHMPF